MSDLQILELPNQILITIFSYFSYEDIKNNYLNLKYFKPILDCIIEINQYKFLGKFELVLDKIVFQYYLDAFNYIDTDYLFYKGIVKEIYHNKNKSIIMWKEKCKKYNFNFDYMPEILKFVLEDYEDVLLDESQNNLNLDSLFLNTLVNKLNH